MMSIDGRRGGGGGGNGNGKFWPLVTAIEV